MTHTTPGFSIHNLSDGETVHQRCVLLKGRVFSPAGSDSEDDYITVETADAHGAQTFPLQTWPTSAGYFKALLMLSPGHNAITLATGSGSDALKHTVAVNYVPLLQYPPLLLAIMVAKDSPLLIDCPPHKARGISSAHADLSAAVAKLRLAAYMWQALTAEDLRAKGLGRRSFRLEEEWAADTVSKDFAQAALEGGDAAEHMRATARVHVVRSERTLAELRDPDVAQQNKGARNADRLYDYFKDALRAHGAPFDLAARPAVAGLLLDAHYSPQQDLIVAHAALGSAGGRRDPALGIFGSHTTWAWPRFVEEVAACLLDTTPSGPSVGDDNGECGTGWQACAVGQGAFLHEVGHAFGCPHTAGIMARGYAHDWPKNFLARTAPGVLPRSGALKAVAPVVDGETPNDAAWDLRDALNFTFLRHFRLPGDTHAAGAAAAGAHPAVEVQHENGLDLRLAIRPPAGVGIARVSFRGVHEAAPSVAAPALSEIRYAFGDLEARFSRAEPLELKVLGMNGKERIIGDVWAMLARLSFVRVPGTDIVLQKRSVKSRELEEHEGGNRKYWQWAAMLKTRGADGKLYRATALDMRVGCILDGGVLFYANGTKVNLGPRYGRGGYERSFGGHASQKIDLPEGVEIAKVEVCGGYELEGYRTHLGDGTFGGDQDWEERNKEDVEVLEAGPDERIVGFFGRSDWGRGFEGVQEFGIITAPKNVDLPDSVYDLAELKNTDGGLGPRPGKRQRSDEYDEEEEDEDEEMDED